MVTSKPARPQPAIAPEKDDAAAAFIAGSVAAAPAPVSVPATAAPMSAPAIAAVDDDDHRLTLRMPAAMKADLDRLRRTKFKGMTLTGVILVALNQFADENKSN
ncbi:MAG: hypothetical protein ACK5XB_10400 [Rhodospirillales bacterium]|jgi:hypothetical protein